MEDALERAILGRTASPGWVTTRGLVQNPAEEPDIQETARIEAAMKRLEKQGLVALWTLKIEHQRTEMLAASRPDYELDKDLERRGAWAKAEPYKEP
jgi:hypothetical protein